MGRGSPNGFAQGSVAFSFAIGGVQNFILGAYLYRSENPRHRAVEKWNYCTLDRRHAIAIYLSGRGQLCHEETLSRGYSRTAMYVLSSFRANQRFRLCPIPEQCTWKKNCFGHLPLLCRA